MRQPLFLSVYKIVFIKSQSVFFVTDIFCFCGIEYEVADRCNKGVNAKGEVRKNEVCESSGCVAFGFQRSVIDDQTSDPTEEECKNKANEFVIIHDKAP